ncbi:MAG: tRNA (guanosine(46)-N7)-methyltransferase TrmB, partial [Oscillospiraceae bacterium]
KCGYELSEVTRNLHEHGICGIMTDYEEKFHGMGLPINRCVATKIVPCPHIPRRGEAQPVAD